MSTRSESGPTETMVPETVSPPGDSECCCCSKLDNISANDDSSWRSDASAGSAGSMFSLLITAGMFLILAQGTIDDGRGRPREQTCPASVQELVSASGFCVGRLHH